MADALVRQGCGVEPRPALLAGAEAAAPPGRTRASARPFSTVELQLDYTRESLTATYRHYRQTIDGREVVGGERMEQTRGGVTRVVYEHLAEKRDDRERARVAAVAACDACVYVNVGGEARLARREIVSPRPLEPHAIYTDAATGALLRDDPLFFTAKARVFDVNPVAKLNDPSLRDQNDAASAVPEAAYSVVDLVELDPATPLSGPNAKIIDTQPPFTPHADPSASLQFDRSQPQFEEVNAYFQIDRSQRYLQSLGYTGARRLVAYPIPIDAHAANGTDNSFYLQQTPPGHGALFFGDGGTDDAEDADIMLHEFFHSVQDWIAPGALAGPPESEARAMAEGGADYWSFSSSYAATAASGRDPYCIADWDARCAGDDPSQQCGYAPGTDCLRRVDSTKTMRDFSTSTQSGTEYENSLIWSSALRELFLKIGKKTTDTLVIESLFGIPPLPTFKNAAQKMIEADTWLRSGADVSAICGVMTARGILDAGECFAQPRGEWTSFTTHDSRIAIPDAGAPVESSIVISDTRPVDRVAVHVDIDHPVRGDLAITLVAPNGVEFTLKQPLDVDRTPGVHATFSVDALHGASAAGTWKLRVQDVFANDAGALVSWSLMLEFTGDVPLTSRPSSTSAKFIPIVAHISDAGGLEWTSDVHLFNRGSSAATVTLIFTPSGRDGTTDFAALKYIVDPQQVVTIEDVVAQMQMIGSGQLEIDGDVIANSRIHADGVGELVPAVTPSLERDLIIPRIQNDDTLRTNIGVAEVGGAEVTVSVNVADGLGGQHGRTFHLAPFSHLQFGVEEPVTSAGSAVVGFGGSGKIAAYAVLIERRTSDPTYVAAATAAYAPTPQYAPIIQSGSWRTEIAVSFSRPPSIITKEIYANGVGIATVSGFVFGSASGRIVFDTPAGSYAESLPFVAHWPSSGDLIGVESSDAFRTNIVLANPGLNTRTVTLRDYDAGGALLREQTNVLAGQSVVLLPLATAASRIHVVGDALVYASLIDRSTGDPMLIPLQ
jgi:subtilisin-like proprotein convertase family protein